MGTTQTRLTNISSKSPEIGAQLEQMYSFFQDMLAECEQITAKGFFLPTHEKNHLDKIVNLLSKVHGTELEFRHHIKHLNKGREVTPDIDNTTDPDLRVFDPAKKYEKIIEFKAVTSSDSAKITGNVKAQLTSAIAQLCKREFSKKTKHFDDYKFKAFLEIRFQSIFSGSPLTNVIRNHQKKSFLAKISLDDVYEYFKSIVHSSFMSTQVTIADLNDLIKNKGVMKIDAATDAEPKIVINAGKNSTTDTRYKGIFQIDFSLIPEIDVDISGTNHKIKKLKMFIFISEDTTKSQNTIYLHKRMAYKIGATTTIHKKIDHYGICTFT